MKTLSHKDRIFWQENGYVLIPNVVPAENLTVAIDAIAEFTGKKLDDKRSWYQCGVHDLPNGPHSSLLPGVQKLNDYYVVQRTTSSCLADFESLLGDR